MPRQYRDGICEKHEGGYRLTAAADIAMKKKIILVLTILALSFLWLNVGIYDTYFAEDNRSVFFIKKHPTLQVRFENIFLTDEDDKPIGRLSDEERRIVINYCKYRLGIETKLRTQEELEACKRM